jgi:hexosaminidase
MKHVLLLLLLIPLLVTAQRDRSMVAKEPAIIPEPAEVMLGEGEFVFNESTRLFARSQEQKEAAGLLRSHIVQATAFELPTVDRAPGENYVSFDVDGAMKKESYRLQITEANVKITAGDYAGLVYGVESLRQLLPVALEGKTDEQRYSVPALTIDDAPRYGWRGLMLDVSRHFFEKEYILETIDRMALFKLNVLHLHLVDDQGWRIEIDKYPLLTEVGAYRVDQENRHWNARLPNEPGQEATYGGYYTKDDIREIVEYARKHGISVMPEIEMPAHVMSAIAAYPEYSCTGEAIAVPSGGVWPITDIYCPGKDATFDFLEDVMLEVMELFPFDYIHVGGDEATRTEWETCEDCQRRMKEEGLETTAELQSYFIRRMERFLSSHGKTLIGWDEILEGGLAPGATVMSWRGTAGGVEAAEQGHDVVMTPGDYVYLNQYQGKPDFEPLAFGGYVPLEKVYSFDPVTDIEDPENEKHILGAQANLWSEFISTPAGSEYMLYPRLAALAEELWTPEDKTDWARFSAKVPGLFERFDAMGVNYSRSAYSVTARSELDSVGGGIQLFLETEFPQVEIHYTLDGRTPDENAPLYTGPLTVDSTTTITAATYLDGKRMGRVLAETFDFHLAVNKPVDYAPLYHRQYPGQGATGMVNVFRGSKNFHDGQWQAWLGNDVELTIDLEEITPVSTVTVGSMEDQGSGIYFPVGVEILLSEDGKDYRKVADIERPYVQQGFVELADFTAEFAPQPARYVRLRVTNLGSPPQGGGSWMFLDEVVVK